MNVLDMENDYNEQKQRVPSGQNSSEKKNKGPTYEDLFNELGDDYDIPSNQKQQPGQSNPIDNQPQQQNEAPQDK